MTFLKFFFMAAYAAIGYLGVVHSFDHRPQLILTGILIGLVLPVIVILIEVYAKKANLIVFIGGIIGITVSLIIANMIVFALKHSSPFSEAPINSYTILSIIIVLSYLGISLGTDKPDFLNFLERRFLKREYRNGTNIKIFDTSVIIDGRIADICETGFIEGELIVPKFVLNELQKIADSSDSLKRNRGRRGLDILQKMQKSIDINIKIADDDFPKIKEVDTKLVALGLKLKGKVVTNDFNLNKVAELQGVSVLNINQLANAVKPVVLPGEVMKVHILKEGKEFGQGVAYLEDGTMVVVDNGKKMIGLNLEVLVKSVLQTTAGRMIFAKVKDEEIEELDS